jgi:Na+/proline symporter
VIHEYAQVAWASFGHPTPQFALLFGLPLLFRFRSTGIHTVVVLLRYRVTAGWPLGLMIGLVVVLVAWLETPNDIRSAINPTDLLNTNHTAVGFLVLT